MSNPSAIGTKSIQGIGWLFLRKGYSNVLRLITLAVLARQLTPEAFGVAALAQVVMGFIILSQETGLASYIIHDHDEGWKERTHHAFWFGLLLACTQVAIVACALPYVAKIYSDPHVPGLICILLGAYIIRQFSTIPEALLRKEHKIREIATRDGGCDLAVAVLSMGMALTDRGVYSLVLPFLIVEPIRLFLIYQLSGWRPQIAYSKPIWKRIGRYSLPLVGVNIVSTVTNNVDTLMVGKVLGTVTLGFYNMAWTLSNNFGKHLSSTLGFVAMSSFAHLKADHVRLQSAYLKVLHSISILSFPTLAGAFVLAPEIVGLLYGEKWLAIVPLFRVFVVFCLVRSVTSLTAVVFNVTGNTGLSLRFTLCFLPFYLFSVWAGLAWGVFGTACCVAGVKTAGALVSLYLSGKCINLRLVSFSKVMGPVLLRALVMALVVFLAKAILPENESVFQVLLLVSVGVAAYLLLIMTTDRASIQTISTIVKALSPKLSRRIHGAKDTAI